MSKYRKLLIKILRLENEVVGSIGNHTSARATSKSAFRSHLSSVACCCLCASHFHVFEGVIWPGSFWAGFSITDSKTVQRSALCKPRRELTSIYLQTLASIQPRTSLVKFACSSWTDCYAYFPYSSALEHGHEASAYSLPAPCSAPMADLLLVIHTCTKILSRKRIGKYRHRSLSYCHVY